MECILQCVFCTVFLQASQFLKEVENTKKSNEELEDKVNRDGLTGLYNHRFMCERLYDISQEKDQRIRYSLGLFDLDDFKVVNDTAGHQNGDELLVYIANKLKLFIESLISIVYSSFKLLVTCYLLFDI